MLLVAIAKLRKVTVSFVVSASLSRHETTASHWTDFHEILYLVFFEDLLRKIQSNRISLKYRLVYTKTYVHL